MAAHARYAQRCWPRDCAMWCWIPGAGGWWAGRWPATLRTELVLDALNMAIWQRRPRGVVHHSDPGLASHLDRVRGALQGGWRARWAMRTTNALCESFFATLECELLDRRSFRSHAEARMAIFEFVEGFYNRRRRHSALGYQSPVAFEDNPGQTAA